MPLFVCHDVQWRDKVVYIRMLIVDRGRKRETHETEETMIRATIRPINASMGRPRCAIRVLL